MSEGSTKGHTRFSLRTMERIVTAAIASVPGTKDLDAKLAGIGGRGYPRVSVQMDPEREVAAVSATIAVVWPSPVTAVAESTRTAISEAIAAHTGYSTTRVNVTVGESVSDTRVTAEQVAQRPAAAAFAPEVTPSTVTHPVTQDSVELRDIVAPEETAVRQVETPREAAVRGISAPPAAKVRDISTGDEVSVRGVSVPSGGSPVRSVDTPLEVPVRSISADLPDHQLREISAPEDHEPRRILDPRPARVRSVRAPRPGRLLPSGQVRSFAKNSKVSVPRPQPLRKIEIDNSRSEQRVRTPKPASLRKVQTPRQAPLKRIEVTPASQRPLHVYAPRPEPLRAISITPFHKQGGNNG